jgi:hypothetical protein
MQKRRASLTRMLMLGWALPENQKALEILRRAGPLRELLVMPRRNAAGVDVEAGAGGGRRRQELLWRLQVRLWRRLQLSRLVSSQPRHARFHPDRRSK